MQSFTLTRPDGQTYRFIPKNEGYERGEYMRADRPDLTIGWDVGWGWCARDPNSGRVASLSLDLPPALQGPRPPLGRWASEAGICELRYE